MTLAIRWPAALLAMACAGCPSQVSPSGDASPDATDVVDASTLDAAQPFEVVLHVAQGPFIPTAPGEAFRVLAVGASGASVEADTDAQGIARLRLDPAGAPWDLTVSRTGYLIVSLLGVRSALDTTVYTEPFVEGRLARQRHTIDVHFRNVGATNVASIFCHTLLGIEYAMGPEGALTLHYDVRPGIERYRFWAIEWVSDDSGFPLRPLRALELPPVLAMNAGDLRFDVDMNNATITPVRSTLQVELPTTGLVTRESVRRGYPSMVQYPFVYELGAMQPGFPVGAGAAEYVRDAPGPLATFVHLGSVLPPEGAVFTYTSEPAMGPGPEISIWPRSFGPNETLTVPEVQALSSAGTTLTDATVETQAPGYDAAGFAVYGADGQSPAWVGWQLEGTRIARRTLPRLPSTVMLRAHFGGPMARVVSTLERRNANTPRPWEPGGARALTVQVGSAPTLVSVPEN